MTHLTKALAHFASSVSSQDIPAASLALAGTAIADLVSVMLAGGEAPVVEILCDQCEPIAGPAGALILLDPERRYRATDAALVNGTAAHALDYDDVAFKSHPSAVLVPAILADAQARGAAGRDVLKAYVVGFEVWGELAGREAGSYHDKGWHPTSVIGPVAAAAALASLRRMDARVATRTISLACSSAAGVVANFGSMTKPLHAGRAARAALEAADLAQAGLTAGEDAVGAPQGWLSALSPDGRFDAERPVRLGTEWHAEQGAISFKNYPVCFASHRIIDATLGLTRGGAISPTDIARIDIRIRPTQARLLRFSHPRDGLEAKFSVHFAVASVLVCGKVGLTSLRDDIVTAAAIRAILDKIRFPGDFDEAAGAADTDRIVITMSDGRCLDSGDLTGTTAAFDAAGKFADCCEYGGVTNARELWDILARLKDLEALSALQAARNSDPTSLKK